jgi:hypothetical protein
LGGITAWKKLDKPLVTGPDQERTLDKDIINSRVTHEPAVTATDARVQ